MPQLINPKKTQNSKRGNFITRGFKSGKIWTFIFLIGFAAVGWLAASTSAAANIACPINKNNRTTDSFGTRGGKHQGIDIEAAKGDPVFAAEDGIAYAKTNNGGPTVGFGRYIILNGTSRQWVYGHLDGWAVSETGTKVSKGQYIGDAGNSGSVRSSTGGDGSHLHLESRAKTSSPYLSSGPVNPVNDWSNCTVGGSGAASDTVASASHSAQPASCTGRPTLRMGAKGPCVKVLQEKLIQVGCLAKGQADGVFGTATLRAVECQQSGWDSVNSCGGKLLPNGERTTPGPRYCDGVVGPSTWASLERALKAPLASGDTGGPDLDSNSNGTIGSAAPQPGQPGQPGASIGEGTGGTGGAGGTATGPNTVGGDGGDGGTGTCIGGCKPGQPGTSTPGTPGTSNPGNATQGSDGADGASGSQGKSGSSGAKGASGSSGTSSGSFSFSGSFKTTCKNNVCTTTNSDSGKTTTTTQPSSSNNTPPAVAQYVLRSHASGRCLDSDGTSRGKDSQIWDCFGNTNQKWGLASDGTIRLGANGMCLEVEGGKTKNGSPVQIYTCNGGSHQRWQWNKDGTIRSTATGKCLDVEDNGTMNGTDVQIWDCYSGAKNQKWGTW